MALLSRGIHTSFRLSSQWMTTVQNTACVKVISREKSTSATEEYSINNHRSSEPVCPRDPDVNADLNKTTATSTASTAQVKPFSAIPGPRGLPLIGSLIDNLRMLDKWHLLHEQRFKTYGRIWKEPLPEVGDLIMIASVQGAKDVVKGEGKYPMRMPIPIWLEYYKTAGHSLGVLQADGEQWNRIRKAVDKPILRPMEVAKHVPRIESVVKDFVARLEELRDEGGNLDRVDLELFKYSLETAGAILYDRRFGCLQNNPPAMTMTFINSVKDMFRLSGELMLHAPVVVRMVKRKVWRRYKECWDNIFKIVTEVINDKIETLDSDSSDSFIGYILSSDALSKQELYSSVTEIMLASVDTTSNTLHAAFYELAKRPDVQEKIYEELNDMCPPGNDITYDQLDKMSYLNGVVKEVLRLYPIAYGLCRKLQKDMVICGYEVPSGTSVALPVYVMGRDPDIFENPTELKPERWQRNNKNSREVDPFAMTPFGVGQRSCVGRRIATVEMQLLIGEMIRRYRLSTNSTEFPINSRVLLTPAQPMHLKLTPRSN